MRADTSCSSCGKSPPEVKFSKKHTIGVCMLCTSAKQCSAYSRTPRDFLRRALAIVRNRAKGKKEVSIDLELLVTMWEDQGGRCALSGVIMTHHRARGANIDFNASIDRIDSSIGYVQGNVQLVANRVNFIKGDMDAPTFNWWLRTLYENTC